MKEIIEMQMSEVSAPHTNLNGLISELEKMTSRPSVAELEEVIERHPVSLSELGGHVAYNARSYRRNLVFETEHVQLLCLCWKSGQRSPIHDHAQSICGVRVIEGIATETLFEDTPSGYLKAVESVDVSEGSVLVSEDDNTHQIANLQEEDEGLVTLHIYAPPLNKMKTFSIDSRTPKTYEPVNEFYVDGGGI